MHWVCLDYGRGTWEDDDKGWDVVEGLELFCWVFCEFWGYYLVEDEHDWEEF